MIVFTDDEGRIKDVNTTSDPNLTRVEVDDEENPLAGWSKVKICSYRVNVQDGHITMLTPYRDTRIIEALDKVGESADTNELDISDVREAIMELYEMIM